MNLEVARTVLIILGLTLLSGFGDAQGFFHGSRMWANGKLVSPEAIKSALGFVFGTTSFLIAIKYIYEIKIVSPEIQTISWFVVTMVGIAILSGKFMHWSLIDQVIGIILVIGVLWLLIRTGN